MKEEDGGFFVRTVEHRPYPNATEVKRLQRSLQLCGRLYDRMLEYKAEGAGVRLRFVDPRDTSRTCSGCGNVVADLPLSQRTYSCVCSVS